MTNTTKPPRQYPLTSLTSWEELQEYKRTVPPSFARRNTVRHKDGSLAVELSPTQAARAIWVEGATLVGPHLTNGEYRR